MPMPLLTETTTSGSEHSATAQALIGPASTPQALAAGDVSRIIEMAWEDRTPFEDIEREYGLNESAVIALMRREMKASSFRMWRKRMTGRTTKHRAVQQVRMQAKERGVVRSVPVDEPAAPALADPVDAPSLL